jgi:hypothetical protein
VVVAPPLLYAFSIFFTPGVLKRFEEGVPSVDWLEFDCLDAETSYQALKVLSLRSKHKTDRGQGLRV